MAEPSTTTQRVQIGVEATAGTSVGADKRLQSISIQRPAPQGDVSTFTPEGSKYPTLTALDREWVTAGLTGRPTYTELVYPLSSVVDTPTIAQSDDGTPATGAWDWTFVSDDGAPDAPETFTVERGNSDQAVKFTHGIVTELNLNLTRQNYELGGSMLGHSLQTDSISMTATPDAIALVPILASQFSLYLDDTSAELGDTKLTRGFAANLAISNRHSAFWTIDSAVSSFAGTIEPVPTVTLTIQVGADATGLGIFDHLRSGATKFIRLEAIGDEIETDYDYRFRFDMAGKINSVPSLEELESYETATFQFHAVYDATWAKAFEFVIRTSLETL